MKLPANHPTELPGRPCLRQHESAFTLVEVGLSAVIAAMTIAGIIYGYTQSSKRAEWSSYSLAAQAAAVQRMEQTRACRWDTETGVDQLISGNFPVQIVLMDLPVIGTNGFYGTNTTTITTISASPPLMRMVRVDCVWRFPITGRLFTNTVATYRSPDS